MAHSNKTVETHLFMSQIQKTQKGASGFPLFCFLMILLTFVSALAESSEAQLLSRIRQLTYDGKRAGEGYFSPDGQSLIFQSEREANNPFYQIYIIDFASGETHRVSPGYGKTTCAFFRPGADEVLFASTHLDVNARSKQKTEIEFRATGKQRRYSWDYDEEMEIFSARRNGTGLSQLTHAYGYDAEASYSPDGKSIVFCSIRDAYPVEHLSPEAQKRLEVDPSYFGEIYVMDADGTNPRRLTSSPGYDGGPFFSPDGKRIIWRRFNEDGTIADIHTMSPNGTDIRRLTDFDCMAWAPFFHPSGRYAIFTANKLGFSNFELFIVDSDGARSPVRVTFTDGFDGLPVFSPDGNQICWTSNRTPDQTSQLFFAEWDHGAALASLAEAPFRNSDESDTPTSVQTDLTESIESFKAHIEFLASDRLEGRLTGSQGIHEAAEYLADRLLEAGLKPLAREGVSRKNSSGTANNEREETQRRMEAFFQNFEFNAGVRISDSGNALTVHNLNVITNQTVTFDVDEDFRPLSFTANSQIESEVVFAGYGLSMPGGVGKGYDSYSGLNVSNKTVLVLRYTPEAVGQKRKQELNRYSNPRYKALIARNHGAKAILLVTGPNSPNAGSLANLSIDGDLSGSEIVAVSISAKVAESILRPSGKSLKALQSQLDIENPHADPGFEVPDLKIRIATSVERIKKEDRNILAILPPGNPSSNSTYVLVGAHYDHLGHGQMSTLATKDEEGEIHNGADDNASGTAMVLELAKSLARDRENNPSSFQHGIIFALWSGEELGLLGSSHFAENSPVDLSNIVAYLNFDMVGRLRENKLNLQGVGSSSLWHRLMEKHNISAGFNLGVQTDPYLPTDVTSLYPKGIPVLNFFTGSHADYHRPTDDPDTLNYEGLTRIAKFSHRIIRDLARSSDRPDYVKVERSDQGGSRDNLRVFLGTIPDYATEVKGVKISGVRAGGPAEKGGLRGMDVIIKFGGQEISNIYDYTYALDAARIGKPIEIVVMRDGKQILLTVVPEARK